MKISLTRPDAAWRRSCRSDNIGCMLGFYLMVGSANSQARLTYANRDAGEIQHEGRPWSESAFVPMHTVSTPEGFYLDPLPAGEVYIIMPATFEGGKTGPFMLSVSTDVDFVLKKDEPKARR